MYYSQLTVIDQKYELNYMKNGNYSKIAMIDSYIASNSQETFYRLLYSKRGERIKNEDIKEITQK